MVQPVTSSSKTSDVLYLSPSTQTILDRVAKDGTVTPTLKEWEALPDDIKRALVLTGSIDLAGASIELKTEVAVFFNTAITEADLDAASKGEWDSLNLPEEFTQSVPLMAGQADKLKKLLVALKDFLFEVANVSPDINLDDIRNDANSNNMSFKEIIALILKLYDKMGTTYRQALATSRVAAYTHGMDAAENRYKSTLKSSWTTIAVAAAGVAVGVGFTANAGRGLMGAAGASSRATPAPAGTPPASTLRKAAISPKGSGSKNGIDDYIDNYTKRPEAHARIREIAKNNAQAKHGPNATEKQIDDEIAGATQHYKDALRVKTKKIEDDWLADNKDKTHDDFLVELNKPGSPVANRVSQASDDALSTPQPNARGVIDPNQMGFMLTNLFSQVAAPTGQLAGAGDSHKAEEEDQYGKLAEGAAGQFEGENNQVGGGKESVQHMLTDALTGDAKVTSSL